MGNKMYGFWERYCCDSIFSSQYKWFDVFRLVCLFGALLAFAGIYIGFGIALTILFILLVSLFVFGILKYIDNDIESAVKSLISLRLLLVANTNLWFICKQSTSHSDYGGWHIRLIGVQ